MAYPSKPMSMSARASFPQIGVDAPLHDAEQGLALRARGGESVLAPFGPAERQVERGLGLVARGGIWRALVEHHLDVGAEQALHTNSALRRQLDGGAVDVGLEGDAALVDAAELGQRHDLIAAGVGEDGLLPMHEFVQAAELGDALGAGPEHQMIGIGEDDIGAARRHVLGEHGLDRRPGANRHEGRGADDAAGRGDQPGPRRAVPRLDRKGEALSHGAGRAGLRRQASPYE